MTAEEKICPVMSRPMEVLEKCETLDCPECRHGGVFKGEYAPFIPCQKERCMAWIGEQKPVELPKVLEGEMPYYSDPPIRSNYCKLIEGCGYRSFSLFGGYN